MNNPTRTNHEPLSESGWLARAAGAVAALVGMLLAERLAGLLFLVTVVAGAVGAGLLLSMLFGVPATATSVGIAVLGLVSAVACGAASAWLLRVSGGEPGVRFGGGDDRPREFAPGIMAGNVVRFAAGFVAVVVGGVTCVAAFGFLVVATEEHGIGWHSAIFVAIGSAGLGVCLLAKWLFNGIRTPTRPISTDERFR